MIRTVTFMSVAALALALAGPVLAQTDLGEDFTGTWGSYSSIDTAAVGSETPQTPVSDANNQSVGTWGGYWPVAGTGGTAGLFLNNSTGFGADAGSIYRAAAGVGAGFLCFPAYTGSEAGAYAYTATFATVELDSDARIEFDATLTQTLSDPASLAVRLVLRVPNNPPTPPVAWIISEPISLAGIDTTPSFITNPASWKSPDGSPGNVPAISVRPDTLAWSAFSVPDATLVPIAASDEAAGVPAGPPIPGAVVAAFLLPNVTGFGIYLDTDITDDGSSPMGQGLWIDAIHLRDAISYPVELSVFQAD